MPSLSYRNKTVILVIKNCAKWDIKVSWPWPVLIHFLNCFKDFVRGCRYSWRPPLLSLRPATLLKKILWHRCFSVNFAKFLRTPFFIEHLWRLLLILELLIGHLRYPFLLTAINYLETYIAKLIIYYWKQISTRWTLG